MPTIEECYEAYYEFTGIDPFTLPNSDGYEGVNVMFIGQDIVFVTNHVNGYSWIELFDDGQFVELDQDFDITKGRIEQAVKDYHEFGTTTKTRLDEQERMLS